MCHFSSTKTGPLKIALLSLEGYHVIANRLFKKAVQVVIGCGAEPTLHPSLVQMVTIAKKQYLVPFVGIATNGQRLSEPTIRELMEGGLDELIISIHGVRKETYEWFQPPASYEKLHQVLSILTTCKNNDTSLTCAIRINFTLNPDNFKELSEFFDVFGSYAISTIQLRIIFDLGETVYHNRDFGNNKSELIKLCEEFKQQCQSRGITHLIPSFQPACTDTLNTSILLPLVIRSVTPTLVWKEDFDWQNETYEVFCKRSGWTRALIKTAFMNRKDALKSISNIERSLHYEIQ
jgi:MoaA/NifB/PqqE/SkfB family radical SAM enzyme